MNEDTALTVAQVATRFGMTEETIRKWIARGTLRAARPGGKSWIIRESDVQAMLDAGDSGFAADRELWRKPTASLPLDTPQEQPAEFWETPATLTGGDGR